jgi:DNA-binding transcriptional ArsR family regulator
MQHRPAKYVIRDQRQLKALVSPARQEVVDALAQVGTASASELAATLGKPADALYYHLRALKKSGLVVHAGFRSARRRQEELFRTIAPDLVLHYQPEVRGNRRAVTAIVDSLMRLGARDFKHAFEKRNAAVTGPRRELWAARQIGWLLPAELESVNTSIKRLRAAVSKPRRGGRLYAITVLLTPLEMKPSDRRKEKKLEKGRKQKARKRTLGRERRRR